MHPSINGTSNNNFASTQNVMIANAFPKLLLRFGEIYGHLWVYEAFLLTLTRGSLVEACRFYGLMALYDSHSSMQKSVGDSRKFNG